jgi:hypothetical protein
MRMPIAAPLSALQARLIAPEYQDSGCQLNALLEPTA